MKSIDQLQSEIKEMRKELHAIDLHLDRFNHELELYKNVPYVSDEYKRIYEIAKTMPEISHPLMKENVSVKNNYFGILFMVCTLSGQMNEQQLLFMQRMIAADKLMCRLDMYLKQLGSIKKDEVLYKMDAVVKGKLGEQLILDLLILLQLADERTRESYECVASIACFLALDKASLLHLGKLSRMVSTQKLERINENRISESQRKFGYYLDEVPGWSHYVEQEESDSKVSSQLTVQRSVLLELHMANNDL